MSMINTHSHSNTQVSTLFGNQAEQRSKGGREYLVVPGVPVQEQVMNTYLLPAEEIQAYINAWNGTPVSIGHAQKNNGSVKVPEPDVPIIGQFYDAHWDEDGRRMLGDYWIDISTAMLYNDGKLILDAIRNGKMLETSTAYWADEEYSSGNFNGRDYKTVHRNTRPDHIAIFAGDISGACSIEDGCGVNRNMKYNADCGCSCGTKQNTALPPFQKGHLPTVMLERLAFDTGYRTPEQLESTRSMVEKNGITKAIWLQRNENGDYKILDGAHRVKYASEFDIEQIPVHVVDSDLNELDIEAIYYKWEHAMDRSYLNASQIKKKRKTGNTSSGKGRREEEEGMASDEGMDEDEMMDDKMRVSGMDKGKPEKKKKKFTYKGKVFQYSDIVWQQSFPGHEGRPGMVGGSRKRGSGNDSPMSADRGFKREDTSIRDAMKGFEDEERTAQRKPGVKILEVDREYNRLSGMSTKELRQEHKRVFKYREIHSGDKDTLIDEILREKYSADNINKWMEWSGENED